MPNDVENCGYFTLRLDELIKEKGISKNRLSKLAKLQRTQLNTYCNNKIQRIDLNVLARICCALDCGIEDIIVYRG